MLQNLADGAKDVAKTSLYAGAGFVTNELRNETDRLIINDASDHVHRMSGIESYQKQDLLDSLGIAGFDDKEGMIETSVGYHGYGSRPTDAYPNGLPNRLLVRSINSGTSFRVKNPYVRRLVNRIKTRAQQKMADAASAKIEELKAK